MGARKKRVAVRASHPRAWRRGDHHAGVARYLRREDEARAKSPCSSRTTCDELPEPRYDESGWKRFRARRPTILRGSSTPVKRAPVAGRSLCFMLVPDPVEPLQQRTQRRSAILSDRRTGGTHEPSSGMRASVSSANSGTHTAPKPIAMSVGVLVDSAVLEQPAATWLEHADRPWIGVAAVGPPGDDPCTAASEYIVVAVDLRHCAGQSRIAGPGDRHGTTNRVARRVDRDSETCPEITSTRWDTTRRASGEYRRETS